MTAEFLSKSCHKFADNDGNHSFDSYRILDIPKQLENENINNFIATYFRHDGNLLIIDDERCAKRMRLYQSIAQRLVSHVLTTPKSDKLKMKIKYDNSKKMTIDEIIESDEFSSIRDTLMNEILPEWDLKTFVEFFAQNVGCIVNSRQVESMHKNYQKDGKIGAQKYWEPSLKQNFRTNKTLLKQF